MSHKLFQIHALHFLGNLQVIESFNLANLVDNYSSVDHNRSGRKRNLQNSNSMMIESPHQPMTAGFNPNPNKCSVPAQLKYIEDGFVHQLKILFIYNY
jgi:hypothetical protein